ncbi:MAG: hypothetical protein LAO51_14710 [Acidobacteriia bacterium]|nr:hypothetical protein [Terriglobia bacterium]
MTDYRVSVGLLRHEKMLRLRHPKMLGGRALESVMRVWEYAAERTERNPDQESGVFVGMSDEELVLALGWANDRRRRSIAAAMRVLDACITCGFLDRTSAEDLRVHGWESHQGWLCGARERSEAARKAACAKHAKRISRWSAPGEGEQGEEAAGRTSGACAPPPSPCPFPPEERQPVADLESGPDGTPEQRGVRKGPGRRTGRWSDLDRGEDARRRGQHGKTVFVERVAADRGLARYRADFERAVVVGVWRGSGAVALEVAEQRSGELRGAVEEWALRVEVATRETPVLLGDQGAWDARQEG